MTDELYATVKKIPTSEILPKYKVSHCKEYVIIQEDTKDILQFCSKDYKLMLNRDVCNLVENLLKKYKIKFQRITRSISRTKFYIDYFLKIKNPIKDILPGFQPCISVWNSYDGSLKHHVNFNWAQEKDHIKIPSPSCHSIDTCSVHCHEHLEKFIKNGKKDKLCFEKLNLKKADFDTISKICKKLKLSVEIKRTAIQNLEDNIKHGLQLSMLTAYLAINKAIVTCNVKELPEFKYKRKKALLLELI